MFRRKIFIHSVIAVICFIILGGVQFFLLYNTYKLKNEHYNLTCASHIEQTYGHSISNDKVFPGGSAVIEHFINSNMDRLQQTFAHDPKEFALLRFKLGDSIISQLRQKNNMDSVLAPIAKTDPNIRSLQYSLYISLLEINFNPGQYFPLFTTTEKNPFVPDDLQTPEGALIGGTLQHPTQKNHIVEITVASGDSNSFRVRFRLFADTGQRKWAIIRLMMPTFLLSLFSILSVMIISSLAFWNWQRQKKLSEMKSDFINSITHEFHTPLATIIVANRTLQNDKLTTSLEQIPPLTSVIHRQTQRLKTMISRVLDITTVNGIRPDRRPVSVHALLEEMLADYRLKHAASQLSLPLFRHAAQETVLADPFWFTTIIVNILDNAVKYNDKEYKEIVVTTRNVRKHLVIEVHDNGIGMDSHTRKHIFEKFFRAPDQVKKESKGLGLGLYYVQMALDAHQWKIEVESRPGQGSTFLISMPLTNP